MKAGVLLGLMACDLVHATAPDAWAAYYKQVTASCVEASGLRDARPLGDPVDFDDRVGYTAMVIQGRYPQSHMKNKRGRMLCLFDKRSQTAHIAPADAMISPRGRHGSPQYD